MERIDALIRDLRERQGLARGRMQQAIEDEAHWEAGDRPKQTRYGRRTLTDIRKSQAENRGIYLAYQYAADRLHTLR